MKLPKTVKVLGYKLKLEQLSASYEARVSEFCQLYVARTYDKWRGQAILKHPKIEGYVDVNTNSNYYTPAEAAKVLERVLQEYSVQKIDLVRLLEKT